MAVDAKDLDMEDSDAYVIEDTVVDYAMVCFNCYSNKLLKYYAIHQRKFNLSETNVKN